MAANSQVWEDDRELDVDWSKARLPGYTVDEFLDRGDTEGAQKELKRLIREGIDSGPAREVPMEEMIAEIHSRSLRCRS